MTSHKTGTREEWRAARLELLEAEKELTRRGGARRGHVHHWFSLPVGRLIGGLRPAARVRRVRLPAGRGGP